MTILDYPYLYDTYLDDIEAYYAETLSEERLNQMLVSMANDGLGWKLTGPLRREFDLRLADGRIQGVIQNAWDEMTESAIESCYEKVYFGRTTAEMIKRSQTLKLLLEVNGQGELIHEKGTAHIDYAEVAKFTAANERISIGRAA